MKRTREAMRERNQIICQIRETIAEKGMTYNELSEAIGMTKDTLAKRLIEQNEFKLIELIVIADYLGIEIII